MIVINFCKKLENSSRRLASGSVTKPAFALGRESALSSPSKAKIIESLLQELQCHFYQWRSIDLYDHESLVKAIKQVDVEISTVGRAQLADQVKIIAAIKD